MSLLHGLKTDEYLQNLVLSLFFEPDQGIFTTFHHGRTGVKLWSFFFMFKLTKNSFRTDELISHREEVRSSQKWKVLTLVNHFKIKIAGKVLSSQTIAKP